VNIETAVAETLTAIATSDLAPLETSTPELLPSATLDVTLTPTNTPPPDGSSLNCDGTYQRVDIIDEGIDGKTIFVENWNGSEWVEVWSLEGGDPMLQQIEDEAGLYNFGECQKLVIVPIRFSGSGAVLDLSVHKWTGVEMEQVYAHDGVHGDWSKLGNTITFHESVYLFNESNCCPCNTQYLEHTWDGTNFEQSGSLITPTYEGTPPAYCQV
jgi:hypothetical protein